MCRYAHIYRMRLRYDQGRETLMEKEWKRGGKDRGINRTCPLKFSSVSAREQQRKKKRSVQMPFTDCSHVVQLLWSGEGRRDWRRKGVSKTEDKHALDRGAECKWELGFNQVIWSRTWTSFGQQMLDRRGNHLSRRSVGGAEVTRGSLPLAVTSQSSRDKHPSVSDPDWVIIMINKFDRSWAKSKL